MAPRMRRRGALQRSDGLLSPAGQADELLLPLLWP